QALACVLSTMLLCLQLARSDRRHNALAHAQLSWQVLIYDDHKRHFTVESNDATELVRTAAENIEELLANRTKALKVSRVDLGTALEVKQEKEKEKRNRFIPDDFEFDPAFKRLVSFNTTGVHIPTDIYEGSTIILNELNWTEALEETFRINKEEDPSLLWQVFGSATGLTRYYPASPWIDTSSSPNKIDLYDVRRRPWYIQGAASPKDMLILVDAKYVRVSSLRSPSTLLTLSPQFNKSARPAACFQNLVQANVRNKRTLKNAVLNIKAEGITNYTSGFELAFQQLNQTNVSRANCNKIIMLFTDGGEEKAEEIFAKYNPNQAVRIFTFSVGQHSYDKGPIQWMACANKGYYYEIPSIGAIRINTQEYLDVLGRPMVYAHKTSKQVQWTNVYLDALELGLVITGTVPVFNYTGTTPQSKVSPKNQLILGVMAVDVSLEDIKRLTPRFTFGPNGYYFAIDPNGYVLLHPNLQPLTARFDEPVTLDFLDAELENEIKVEMRRKMIDGERGSYTISTLVKSQDERYIDQGQRTYTFTPVKDTDYSLALVLPEYSMHYIRAKIDDTITQKPVFNHIHGYICSSHRLYCNDLKPLDKNTNNTEFLMELNNYIDIKTPNDPNCKHGVVARFVATDGGITRVFPKSAGLDWNEEAETYESSFYKRSLDNDLYIFTPAPNNGNPEEKRNIDCVFLDDGGFLVMSNQDDYNKKIGKFFGTINPSLMRTMVNVSLFTSISTYDYQSLCDPKEKVKSAAGLRSIYVVSYTSQRPYTQTHTFTLFHTPEMDDDAADAINKDVCITKQTQYYFGNKEMSFSGLFYLAESPFELCRDPDSTPPADGPDPCEVALNPRYRKGPSFCFDKTENEKNHDCGGVSSLSPTLWLLVILQVALLWVVTDLRDYFWLVSSGHYLS
uniref:Calcium channel, voltage-dependent, alpha 2/delta subunit 1a n=1 Tax=Nothobranchius furzeri TaxID=105023 RepID=A0A8C6NKA3_NOTFU